MQMRLDAIRYGTVSRAALTRQFHRVVRPGDTEPGTLVRDGVHSETVAFNCRDLSNGVQYLPGFNGIVYYRFDAMHDCFHESGFVATVPPCY